MLEMNANLMSSTTVQPALKQGCLSSRAHDFEIGSRHAPAFTRNRHLLAMNPMTCNRRDDAPGSAPQFPGNKREVDLLNRARRELPGKVDVRKVILRRHQTTARFFIQSMNNARSLLAVVFEQDGERDLLRGEIDRFHWRLDQGNAVACSNHVARTRSSSIYCYVTLANKRLNSRPGKFRRRFSEKTIQPRVGIHWRDIEFAAVLLCH